MPGISHSRSNNRSELQIIEHTDGAVGPEHGVEGTEEGIVAQAHREQDGLCVVQGTVQGSKLSTF